MTPARDVVVIGGGAMGGAAAVHLLEDPAFDGRVTIIERDPTYRRASSALMATVATRAPDCVTSSRPASPLKAMR